MTAGYTRMLPTMTRPTDSPQLLQVRPRRARHGVLRSWQGRAAARPRRHAGARNRHQRSDGPDLTPDRGVQPAWQGRTATCQRAVLDRSSGQHKRATRSRTETGKNEARRPRRREVIETPEMTAHGRRTVQAPRTICTRPHQLGREGIHRQLVTAKTPLRRRSSTPLAQPYAVTGRPQSTTIMLRYTQVRKIPFTLPVSTPKTSRPNPKANRTYPCHRTVGI